ncbi:MAG: NADAR family protein [Planctomycetes bacterium]|nr:NADAR family protein [Planctomycetota bacterium]
MAEPRRTVEDLVETDRFVLFWRPPAVFSQWTPAAFTVDGVRYTSAEQFMMAEKARLFSDEATRARILATDSPREQKRLGRQVAGFDDAVWERERLEVVVRGNRAKFSQDPALLAALLATGDKALVEASPYDRIWGIGRRPTDPKAQEPAAWRGLNLLGEALERVRAELRAGPA